jgi:uncharacterized membrane protein YphA (DoxX/SURF4 family)
MVDFFRSLRISEHRFERSDLWPAFSLLWVRIFLITILLTHGLAPFDEKSVKSINLGQNQIDLEIITILLDPYGTYLLIGLLGFGFLTRWFSLPMILVSCLPFTLSLWPISFLQTVTATLFFILASFGAGRFSLDRWLYGRA